MLFATLVVSANVVHTQEPVVMSPLTVDFLRPEFILIKRTDVQETGCNLILSVVLLRAVRLVYILMIQDRRHLRLY